MGDFLLIARDSDQAPAIELSRDLAEQAGRRGLSVRELNRRAWLATPGPADPGLLKVGPWSLVGDVFDRRSPRFPAETPGDAWDYERKLLARFWGRFAGFRFGARDRLEAILRDPSGALECVCWSDHGLTIACSAVEDWLLNRLRPPWRIGADRLAAALADPMPATGALLLDGPVALEPGTVQPLPLDRPACPLWLPAHFARRSLGPSPSPEAAAGRLRSAIDEAVAGLASLPGPLGAEVSGGLDSSIVASSLRHAGCDVRLWLNAHGAAPEADERPYARALGHRLGFTPTLVPHASAAITRDWLETLSPDFRPGLNALDQAHDLDWAERLTRAGVAALMTGKGGDSVLLNRATSDVFVDQWRDRGWPCLWSRDVLELATSNEVSIWTFLRRAREHRRTGNHLPPRDHPMLTRGSAPAVPHPWIEDWNAFGPAKAIHLASLADTVARHGPSALTRVVDVRNPLCAQPVVETCLSLPAALLTLGGRERGLARRAFADRLPPEILDRRSKGDMTKVYGRMILNSLGVLRPWLIEGRLAALGVIDRAGAEASLTREALVWRGRYSAIMIAAAFESWVRNWEARLSPRA